MRQMPVALCTTSHSPLVGLHDPEPRIRAEVDAVLAGARTFAAEFGPDLVVVFAPDHYNGFLYDLMPPFCIGSAATSVGDYGLTAGPLNVDRTAAHAIADDVLQSGIDIAVSEDMHVDHGLVQPLTFLFPELNSIPVVPVFINCVAYPLGPAVRARLLGAAIGASLRGLERRVLVVGSGGLSHDPPVPRLSEAPPDVADRLTHGRNPTREQRAKRESGTLAAAREFAQGRGPFRALNPEWDALVLRSLAAGDFAAVDEQPNDWFVEQGGHSAHEVRTWIAAYAALAAQGPYEVCSTYYRAIPEWFAGFATTTARPTCPSN